jgi:hypothetical protein
VSLRRRTADQSPQQLELTRRSGKQRRIWPCLGHILGAFIENNPPNDPRRLDFHAVSTTMIFIDVGFCLGHGISPAGGFLRMQRVEDKRTHKVV